MRLIFKKPIDEKINEALNEAVKNDKEVEEIVLTRKELDELKDIVKIRFKYASYACYNGAFYRGVPIKVEEKC
jgi:hypothetical protein